MVLNENYILSNGVIIPKIGLGMWMIEDNKAAQAVRDGVTIGYRHFDTAAAYGNERGVGEGIRSCNVAREQLFITTKLEAACKDYAEAKAAIDSSLQKLKLDMIDLMLIHSPQPWTKFRENDRFFEGNLEAWRALEEAQKAGKLRAIGVSNFDQPDLDNILDNCSIKPVINQILAHISNTPFELIAYCEAKGIMAEAYSPIGHGEMLTHQDVGDMAQKYDVSIAQLCIRYCLQLGLLPLPKTENPIHMRANVAVDFEISQEDMKMLKDIDPITTYGKAGIFPVFGGRLYEDGRLEARN